MLPDEKDILKPEAAAPEVEVSTDLDVEIEIVDDTPEKDRGRRPLERPVEEPTEEEIENYSDGVKKRIKELTHARHDERRAKEALLREREELEKFTRQLMQENKSLKTTVNMGSQHYVQTLQSKAETDLEMARKKYKEAYEAGDADALVAAQEALADAKLQANAAKNYRPTPLQETEYPVQQSQPVPQQQPQPSLDEKTVRWQAKNQWFGAPGYEEITSFSLGLHQKLVNNGVDPRSDEYFEQIDARLRSKFPEVFETDGKEGRSSDTARKPATVVAPAVRSAGATKIRLSASQVALAKKFGLTPQQYAAEIMKLEKRNG
jgi:hypothetical protein